MPSTSYHFDSSFRYLGIALISRAAVNLTATPGSAPAGYYYLAIKYSFLYSSLLLFMVWKNTTLRDFRFGATMETKAQTMNDRIVTKDSYDSPAATRPMIAKRALANILSDGA
jgi:hypothetical protein